MRLWRLKPTRIIKKKHHPEEQIVSILREADEGRGIEDVCRDHDISKASFHCWKSKYGQMELRDVKRLKELERENAELKKTVAAQLLNIRVLEHVNAKKW